MNAKTLNFFRPGKAYRLLLLLTAFTWGINHTSRAQDFQHLSSLEPEVEYDNVHVVKLSGDSLQSSFVIWIRKGVQEHFHREHSESVYVLEGEGMMSLNDELFLIRPGDYVFIPKGTPHSVTQVLGDVPLKVISIQAPVFDGTDRVFTGD